MSSSKHRDSSQREKKLTPGVTNKNRIILKKKGVNLNAIFLSKNQHLRCLNLRKKKKRKKCIESKSLLRVLKSVEIDRNGCSWKKHEKKNWKFSCWYKKKLKNFIFAKLSSWFEIAVSCDNFQFLQSIVIHILTRFSIGAHKFFFHK